MDGGNAAATDPASSGPVAACFSEQHRIRVAQPTKKLYAHRAFACESSAVGPYRERLSPGAISWLAGKRGYQGF